MPKAARALDTRTKPASRRRPTKAKPRSQAAAKKPARKRPARPKPKSQPAPRSNGTTLGEAKLRFQMASLLRLSENLVTRAVNAYDKLFALEPADQGDIYLQMGKELAQRGVFDEAVEVLRKALELRPDDVEASVELGLVHMQRKAPQAAAQALEQAKRVGKPSHRVSKALAEAYIALERFDEALEELDIALRLEPDVAESYYQLGVVLDRLGRFPEALKAFDVAIDLDPAEVVYHQSLGFTLESMGRRKEAIKQFKKALELERSPAARLGAMRK